MPIAETLAAWQKAGDERMFKLIVSPEFGERLDLARHTKELVGAMEKDLGTRLQWVAAEHFNTDHPHVHLTIRGVDEKGLPLRIGREYLSRGIRDRAQHLATNQVGYRTQADIKLAADRQVLQMRWTDIDRGLAKKAVAAGAVLRLDYSDAIPAGLGARERRLREIRRLQQLVGMGLAEKTGPMTWEVNRGFEGVLRQMQVAGDRQKSLHQHREVLSDPRLPLVVTNMRSTRRVAGRVLGTGLDDATGKPFVLVEGTDAKVHYLYHDESIHQARQQGQMQPGSFVELERRVVGGGASKRAQTVVIDRGNADTLLANLQHFKAEAIRSSTRRPTLPEPGSLGGWLGRYRSAVAKAAADLAAAGQLKLGPHGYEYQAPRARTRS